MISLAPAPPSPRLDVDAPSFRAIAGSPPVEWLIWPGLSDYDSAVAFMEARVGEIAVGTALEAVLLIEHPPLYTAGTSALPEDLVDAGRFPVHASGRGGEYTYHGPGQRVAYVLLDLKRRRQDVRAFVSALENWIIGSLDEAQVRGERREDRVGVWVARPDRGEGFEDKIAAIGVRLRRWVSFHGISINVEPDLSHFNSIVPCGIVDPRYGVTSLVDLGLPVSMNDVDAALRQSFADVFGEMQNLSKPAT